MAHQLAWLAGMFGGVVVVAALVNRFARANRHRLRRAVVLFSLFAVSTVASLAFASLDPRWSNGFSVASDLFAAFTIANTAGMLLFLIIMPAIFVGLPMIAGDLVVGLAYLVALVVVLSRHGLDPTSALATGAVVSAVLAISLQTTLGNILGGVALQLDGSIHEGDRIRLENGKAGKIRAIRWRHTLVDTGASTIVVPNALLLLNNITILGWRGEPLIPQPVNIRFGIDVQLAPDRITRIVNDALAASPVENVGTQPAPSCKCADLLGGDGFATYSVDYTVIDPDRADDTASRVRSRVHAALRRAHIKLAVPGRAAVVEMRDRVMTERDHEEQTAKYLTALHAVHLFSALSEQELRTLAEGMMYVPFSAGETILRQGSTAHSLFVLTSGTCEVRTRVNADRSDPPAGPGVVGERTGIVATLTAPDFFGEMGLMTGEPRKADVIAKTDVECFRLLQATFETVLTGRPEILTELAERLASRNVALSAAREHLDDAARKTRHASEIQRIRDGIKDFFGL